MPDREKVIKGLECCGEDAYGCCRECPYNDHRIGTIEYCTSALCADALALLKEQPDIVRCKDCKYWQDNNNGYPHPDCRWREDETPDPDDYCSFGEAKQDA